MLFAEYRSSPWPAANGRRGTAPRVALSWLVVSCLFAQQLAHPAQQQAQPAGIRSRSNVQIEYEGIKGTFSGGSLTMRKVSMRQGEGTLIRAEEGSVTGIEGDFDNSHLQLSGTVHVEFDGAVLDADTAEVTFAKGRLTTVRVRGVPARFSHQAKNDNIRRQGRAPAINYNSSTGWVQFSGGTSFSQVGKDFEYTGEEFNYNVNTTVFDDGNTATPEHMLIPDARSRVPPPRTPDRSTSQ
jgi:lipopolysaccharide export system protein LptA